MRCGRDWNGCWRIGCHCCRMWGWGSCSSWLVDRRRHLRCSSRWDGVCCMKYAGFRKWGGGWCSCTWLGREREKRCWQHWTGVWRMRSDWCRKLCGVWCSSGGCVRNEIRGAVGVRIGSVVCNGVQCIFVCRLWC